MYGIEAESELPESELNHLSGYQNSGPVRIGNGAYNQHQLDVFGEVLDWADIYVTVGGRLSKRSRAMLSGLADVVAAHWRQPDQGIWEGRGAPRHYVHSKIMAWVTLDRAIKLFGRNAVWAREREEIAKEIRRKGIGPSGNLLQSFDGGGLDAAALISPLLGFPLQHETLEVTVRAVEEELCTGDFVHRYRSEDRLAGGEGAFFICSFWLVDALLVLGRAEAAESLFDRLVANANDVGLYSEEVDPHSRAFLGNFPQAFTHLALIASASHLELYKREGPAALEGTYADRLTRSVGATLGWRGIWAAFKATKHVGRIRSSRASVLKSEVVSPGERSRQGYDGSSLKRARYFVRI
jgi:alpha,alpha-trehalase